MTDRPSMGALWEQAWEECGNDRDGDARRERYAALLSEHGYTRLLTDGDPSADLPCGFRGSDF